MRCRIVQALCRGWRTDVYVPGNLLIQPNFACHDHTNNSNEQIIWIDALDSGLVNYLCRSSVNMSCRTGDLGVIGGDGYLRLVGQIKEMIRVGGETGRRGGN